jgi:hypothetical protein
MFRRDLVPPPSGVLLLRRQKQELPPNFGIRVPTSKIEAAAASEILNRNAYRIMVGKPEGKRPLRRPRRRWVDNIKMDLRGIGWGGVDWIDLAQDRDQWRALVNTVMNLRVP